MSDAVAYAIRSKWTFAAGNVFGGLFFGTLGGLFGVGVMRKLSSGFHPMHLAMIGFSLIFLLGAVACFVRAWQSRATRIEVEEQRFTLIGFPAWPLRTYDREIAFAEITETSTVGVSSALIFAAKFRMKVRLEDGFKFTLSSEQLGPTSALQRLCSRIQSAAQNSH